MDKPAYIEVSTKMVVWWNAGYFGVEFAGYHFPDVATLETCILFTNFSSN